MEIYSVITTALTLVTGGGWFIHYRANKRKADGEASQAEADGWARQQEVYQKTIDDIDKYCDKIRDDRDQQRVANDVLRKENEELRKNQLKLENEVLDIRRVQARQGMKLQALSPLLCGVQGCQHRKKVTMIDDEIKNDIIQNNDANT